MKLPGRKKQILSKNEWLGLVPSPECASEWEDQQIVLLIPRARNPVLKFFVSILNSKPHFRLKLDEVGSFVWQQMDGRRTIKEICKALEAHFQDRVAPAEDRTIEFFKRLYLYRAVRFYTPPETQ